MPHQSPSDVFDGDGAISLWLNLVHTGTEVAGFSGPLIVLSIGLLFGGYPSIFSLVFCGWGGLTLGLSAGRWRKRFAFVTWERPTTRVAQLTTILAYCCVLGMSVVVALVICAVTSSFLVSGGIAALAPIWFLKHLLFILELDT